MPTSGARKTRERRRSSKIPFFAEKEPLLTAELLSCSDSGYPSYCVLPSIQVSVHIMLHCPPSAGHMPYLADQPVPLPDVLLVF